MPQYNLGFSSSSAQDEASFKLLELPPELLKVIEDAEKNSGSLNFQIKGQATEDAVLCTLDKTYALRSVLLSNAVLVVTTPEEETSDAGTVVIRDQLHEIVEVLPTVPRVHKLDAMLKGLEYDDDQEDVNMDETEEWDQLIKQKRVTYDDASAEIQASEYEFNCALKTRHILNLNGCLRPIVPAHLNMILELLLGYLVSLSLSHTAASVEELASTLADEHEVPRQVSTQIMLWFGEINEGSWAMNVNEVLKEVGLGILRNHKDDPIQEGDFLAKWKAAVGDTFESAISLALISGNYLINVETLTDTPVNLLTFFPAAALPVNPTARFTDLFLTRARWRGEDIAPFLMDVAVNNKERDRLLLKYARAVTDGGAVWYTARAK